MSKLLGAIQQNREAILQDWLERLRGAVRRRDLTNERQLGLVIVSHDIGVVAHLTHRIVVMASVG